MATVMSPCFLAENPWLLGMGFAFLQAARRENRKYICMMVAQADDVSRFSLKEQKRF